MSLLFDDLLAYNCLLRTLRYKAIPENAAALTDTFSAVFLEWLTVFTDIYYFGNT